MRIVIDLQGAQTESRFRGIGRYTMAFARGVVENCGDHEVILALSGLFPDTIEPIRSAFEDLLPKKNIRVWYAPQRVQESIPGNEKRREVAELVRESFLASLQPDVVHLTSLFEGFVDDAVTSVGRLDSKIPVSIALYDLIPLLNPEQYLKPSPRYSDFYARKVEYLQKADLCLAISKFAQQECGTALESLKGKTVNVSTAITGSFEPKALNPSTERALREKFGIKGSFVLYSGGSDERKNLTRLITAYAALPSELRQSHQLVFAGRMPQGDVDRFKREARSEGLTQEELCFTGYISDDELVHLYSLCELYVFPSWHEGFGLPALEAMACGAPVIGANTSSVPEVIGLEEALFDPFDVSSIQAKMKQALIDPSFRARLKAHGEKRAEIFSWEETAQRAITAWEELVIEEKQNEDQIFSNSWAAVSKSLNGNYSNLISSLGLSMSAGSTLDDQDMKLLAKCIDLNEREVFSFFRCRELPEKINWRIEGPFDSSYSLALVNRETARGLSSLGHEVSLHSTEGPGDFDPDVKFLGENPDLNEMYRRVNTTPDSDADVVSRNLYPPRVLDMPGRLNLLHGYAWEESGFPAKWVEDFNQALQGILVTSSHVKKVLIDNGVAVPIAVTGNGVDHWNRITPQKTKRVSDRRFKFLHVSSCFPRKGADRMLEAYGRAFSSRDDVTLVIKTFENPHNDIHRWLEEARSKSRDFPDVVVLEGDFTDAELKGLYEQCDSLVAPSRAEGFGLPMAEAMLSGLAVITTNWSGQVDFCTPDTAWLVDYQFERAKSHFNLFSSVWADPDVGHLASAMRDVFEATDFERQKRINAGRKLLAADYSWARVAEKMTQAASEWSASLDPVEPSIGWVTTWNTRCGIATYSKHLLENMPSHATIFAPYSQELIEQDTKNVNRCWEDGDRDALVELGNAVNGAKVDTLVVQFNYGFFGFEAFSDFLNKQVDAGRKVVVMMHATNDPAHAPGKKLETL
ncbi:mannosyltransferase, partial [Marinobacter sp. Z-F4-2]